MFESLVSPDIQSPEIRTPRRAEQPAAPHGSTSPLPPTLPGGEPWPRISIVTPSFNQGRYIEQTIQSVMQQGYPDVEHIVIDGGSTDETLAILDKYRASLAHVVSEPDRGQSHALNKGFARATGEIFTWLNSDDMLAPGALAAAAIAFHQSRADMIAGVCQLQSDGQALCQHLTSCTDGPLPLEDLLDLNRCWLRGQFFYQPEVMFTRHLWERAGGHVDESCYYSMDYELWLRFAEAGARLHVVGRPLAIFRVHPDQKTSAPPRFQQELVEVRDAYLKRLGRANTRFRPAGRERAGLRIAFFNDIGEGGGASMAHMRLAQACAWAGHEVFPIAVVHNHLMGQLNATGRAAIISEIAGNRPDLVIVGNLHNVEPRPDLLEAIAARWPTVFVMHDVWAVTGRCAYAGDCEKYLSGCDDSCPTVNEYPALEPAQIRPAWETKRRILNGPHAPLLLAVSPWTAEFARRAVERRCPGDSPEREPARVEEIRNCLPLDVFRPLDKRECRRLLGLPEESFIIMTSAASIRDPRKGLAHLAEALDILKLPNVHVIGIGATRPGEALPIPGMQTMGYVRDRKRMAMLYSAADLFVSPSLQEAFGMVFVEAAACGTPAIGYPVGGVPTAIADGVTGRIARSVDPRALADTIRELYEDDERRRNMGIWARLHVENEWSISAAYRSFWNALGRAGWRDRFGLPPRIQLQPHRSTPRPIQYITRVYPEWEAIYGREVPTESDGITSFRHHDLFPRVLSAADVDAHAAVRRGDVAEPPTVEEKNARMAEALRALARDGIRRFAIYGAGQHTWDCVRTISEAPLDMRGVIDDRAAGRFAGWTIVAPEDVEQLNAEAVVLSSDFHEHRMWAKREVFESRGLRVVRLYESSQRNATHQCARFVSTRSRRETDVECNICGWYGERMESDNWHPHTICPNCHSQVRHRLLMASMGQLEPVSLTVLVDRRRILHFAPEPALAARISTRAARYVTADYLRAGVDLQLDISAMPTVADASFDLLIACDVLEHVEDDHRAMREIRRVLAPGGTAILTVPQKDGLVTTFEDPSVIAPADRERVFGQRDHLRIYGDDFPDQLRAAGFDVCAVTAQDFPPDDVRRGVLFPPVLSDKPLATNHRKIFFARRPA